MSVLPATGYRYRSLAVEQAREVRRAHGAGASVRDLADAYGVSSRTIYRALSRAYEPVYEIVVEGWRTEVAMTEEGPVLIKPWTPAP